MYLEEGGQHKHQFGKMLSSKEEAQSNAQYTDACKRTTSVL